MALKFYSSASIGFCQKPQGWMGVGEGAELVGSKGMVFLPPPSWEWWLYWTTWIQINWMKLNYLRIKMIKMIIKKITKIGES